MMQLIYQQPADTPDVAEGSVIEVPHYWHGWPDHEVTVAQLLPPGPRGRWAYGVEKHGFRVQVWIRQPSPQMVLAA
jgi:hypothetical protein